MCIATTSMNAGIGITQPKPRNLPNRILRAIDNALHLDGLPRSLRATLADICRFVPQSRPFDTVFAHKEKIAQRTGASERTVYRHLQSLQASNMVEVLDQERKSRNGRFSVSRIRLTRRAAGLLGFIEIEEDLFIPDAIDTPPSEPTDQGDPAAAASDAEITGPAEASAKPENPVIHSQPHAILSDGHTLTKPTISSNQPTPSTKNGLPIDLTWLTGNGVSRSGVFKLMKKASIKGKRLSDIVIACMQYIAPLTGGRLYTYLAQLADGPTDFSVQAANERKRIADFREQEIFTRKCKIFRERFKKTTLTNRAQTRLYFIDESAQYVQVVGKGQQGSAPLNDLTTWIDAMETGQLVLATLEAEKRITAMSQAR